MGNYFSSLVKIVVAFLSIILISGCSHSVFSFIGINDKIDNSLPQVTNIKVLPDVSIIGFEWNLPSDLKLIGGYVLYRLNGEKWDKVAIIKNPLSTHAYDKNLQAETKYTYALASLGKDGSVSPKSVKLRVSTSYISPVDFVYASSNYARSVKIIWSPSANPIVKRYIIQRENKDKKFIKIGTTDNRFDVEYFDMNLDDGTTYTYKVIGQGYDGILSRDSLTVQGTTKTLPNPIINISASSDKPRAIWVNWKESEDAEVVGYNVFSSDNINASYKLIAFVKGNSYIDKIEEDGVTRYYKITALDSTKLESKPSQGAAIGSTLPPPQSPTIIQSSLKNKQAYISWSKINDKRVVGYVVYRQSGYFKDKDRFLVNDIHFTDKEMQEGVTYSYTVSSIDENNIESLPSKNIEMTLPKEELKAITTTTTTFVNSKGEVVDKKVNTKSSTTVSSDISKDKQDKENKRK